LLDVKLHGWSSFKMKQYLEIFGGRGRCGVSVVKRAEGEISMGRCRSSSCLTYWNKITATTHAGRRGLNWLFAGLEMDMDRSALYSAASKFSCSTRCETP
ncbi:hypothetical protein PV326_007266, partial [Microctonus aethiopoides]